MGGLFQGVSLNVHTVGKPSVTHSTVITVNGQQLPAPVVSPNCIAVSSAPLRCRRCIHHHVSSVIAAMSSVRHHRRVPSPTKCQMFPTLAPSARPAGAVIHPPSPSHANRPPSPPTHHHRRPVLSSVVVTVTCQPATTGRPLLNAPAICGMFPTPPPPALLVHRT